MLNTNVFDITAFRTFINRLKKKSSMILRKNPLQEKVSRKSCMVKTGGPRER